MVGRREVNALQRRVFQNETIYLPDLARTGVIVNATFENCDLRGPAVVGLLGNVRIEGLMFGIENNDIETILWEVPEGAYKIGAIGLQDPTILGGRTEALGFIGTRLQLDAIRQSAV
jgi:hypothetical protein